MDTPGVVAEFLAKFQVFWNPMPCRLVTGYGRFEVTQCIFRVKLSKNRTAPTFRNNVVHSSPGLTRLKRHSLRCLTPKVKTLLSSETSVTGATALDTRSFTNKCLHTRTHPQPATPAPGLAHDFLPGKTHLVTKGAHYKT